MLGQNRDEAGTQSLKEMMIWVEDYGLLEIKRQIL